jgi:hypothetical protein
MLLFYILRKYDINKRFIKFYLILSSVNVVHNSKFGASSVLFLLIVET